MFKRGQQLYKMVVSALYIFTELGRWWGEGGSGTLTSEDIRFNTFHEQAYTAIPLQYFPAADMFSIKPINLFLI